MTAPHRRILSVVVPVYEEADVVEAFHERLSAVLQGMPYDAEVIYVDDGSSDASPSVLRGMAKVDPRVGVLRLSRNFGHQIALTAGLDVARGDAVITMDGDLQMRPEDLPRFVERWEAGAEVVNGRRADADDIGWLKRATSRGFYRLINRLSDVHIEPNAPDFRLLDRAVVDAFRRMRESDRFIRGMVASLGFTQATVEFQADPRYAGASKYTLRKMLRLAFDGVVSFSVVPLRIAIVGGLLSAVLGAVYGAYAVGVRLFTDAAVEGWTSLIVINLFLGGMILVSLGVIGEYVGRIYRQVKSRPLYFVSAADGVVTHAMRDRSTAEGSP